jgi:hypothetical protein
VTQDLGDLREAKKLCSRRFLKTQTTVQGLRLHAASPAPNQNVVGVGISEKIVEGVPSGILCVKIYVRTKYPSGQLLRKERLPKTTYGLPVDVVEVGTLRSLATATRALRPRLTRAAALAPTNLTMPNPRERFRPARPGCSIGFEPPVTVPPSSGTFGALVQDANGFYILSNNHVLANENILPPGSNILQPSSLDDPNVAGNRIGTLTRFVPLVSGTPNKVDCAIAKVSGNQASNAILHIGAPLSKGNASMEKQVHKFGLSTSYRVGRVIDIEADVTINFANGAFKFDNQIMILGVDGKAFAQRGDSGALVLERETQKAVGLLFGAGVNNAGQIYGVANHINEVLSALGVTLVL